jgi:hypothetical protein
MKQVLSAAIVIMIAFTSCSKESTTSGSGSTTGSFTWTENNGSTNTADSAVWVTGTWGTGIRAYKGGQVQYFEINWATQNNITTGTKTLDAQVGFTFIKNGIAYVNRANESLSITASSNNQISGTGTFKVLHIQTANQIDMVFNFTNLSKR